MTTRYTISVENLGKHYVRGIKPRSSLGSGLGASSGESLTGWRSRLRLPGRRKQAGEIDERSFWALRHASFEVQRGDVVGLIGRNGAGKSTLLKILSRIVEPTEGIARLRGRVASLLEVGTGFHGDLSGRENIYLNGAIMGMRKAEINRKFDEIVAFSEVGKFLDTRVHFYSTGMYLRLAFAVAAHLDPEILIVDEVLAVGDQAFQNKCLGKMQNVASTEGRTVIFVSHNMAALTQLCQRGILLEQGRVKMVAPIRTVIESYLGSSLDHNPAHAQFAADLSKPVQYISAEILHDDGGLASEFSCDESVTIRLIYEVRSVVPGTFLTFSLRTIEGTTALFSDIRDRDVSAPERLSIGKHAFEIKIPPRLLSATTYRLDVTTSSKISGVLDHRRDCCEFTLRDLAAPNQTAPWHRRGSASLGAHGRSRGGPGQGIVVFSLKAVVSAASPPSGKND